MKLSEILQLDAREADIEPILKRALIKIVPPLKDKDQNDISVEVLEKVARKVAKKYDIGIAYILSGPSDESYYSFMIKSLDKHEHIDTVYAMTIFEGFAKSIIRMFAYIKKREEEANED